MQYTKKGLTLLEIMIAIAIFVTIMGTVISSLVSIQGASRTITTETQLNELCSRIALDTSMKLSSSKILVANVDKVTYQHIVGIYPDVVLDPPKSISFSELKTIYPEIDESYTGAIRNDLIEKYKLDKNLLRGVFFAVNGQDMIIGVSASGDGDFKHMHKSFLLETKLLGDVNE